MDEELKNQSAANFNSEANGNQVVDSVDDLFGDEKDIESFDKKSNYRGKEIVFDGEIDADLKGEAIKTMKRKRSIKFFIFGTLSLLIMLFIFYATKAGGKTVWETDSVFAVIVLMVLTALFFGFAIKDLFVPYTEKEKNKSRHIKIAFDPENKTFDFVPQDGAQFFAVPLIDINYFSDLGTHYVIHFLNEVEEKKGKHRIKFKKVVKSFSVICQKNLLKKGSIADFEALIKQAIEDRRIAEIERRKGVNKYAIIAIITALVGVAIAFPLVKFAVFLLTDYMDSVYQSVFGSIDSFAELFALLFIGIFVLFYWAILGVVAIVCFVAPVPLFITSLVNLIIQFTYNRKWWTWVALAVNILSFVGTVAIFIALLST